MTASSPSRRALMLPLRGVTDPAAIGREVALLAGKQAALIDLKRESGALYQSCRREVITYSLPFANVTATIAFGLLAFSKVPVPHAIGSTLGIGAVLSLAFSAILITRAPNQTGSLP